MQGRKDPTPDAQPRHRIWRVQHKWGARKALKALDADARAILVLLGGGAPDAAGSF